MAVMNAQNRLRTRIACIRQHLLTRYDKPTLDTVIAAVDQWAEDNSAEYNSALPVGFRTTATVDEKSLMLAMVVLRRAGLLKVEEDN